MADAKTQLSISIDNRRVQPLQASASLSAENVRMSMSGNIGFIPSMAFRSLLVEKKLEARGKDKKDFSETLNVQLDKLMQNDELELASTWKLVDMSQNA